MVTRLRTSRNSFSLFHVLLLVIPFAVFGKHSENWRLGPDMLLKDKFYLGGRVYYSPSFLKFKKSELGIDMNVYINMTFANGTNQSINDTLTQRFDLAINQIQFLNLSYTYYIQNYGFVIYFYSISSSESIFKLLDVKALLPQFGIIHRLSNTHIELHFSLTKSNRNIGVSYNW